MFWSNITIHGNCAMVFVIHNQTFFTLGKTLTYLFLFHIVAQNASHSLRLTSIHNSNKVIKFEKCSCTFLFLLCNFKLLVEF
jgi:hypothetical protein